MGGDLVPSDSFVPDTICKDMEGRAYDGWIVTLAIFAKAII